MLPESDLTHVIGHTRELWGAMRGQSVFITGGTGFVGTWLLGSLLRANDEFSLKNSIFVLTRRPERYLAAAKGIADHPAVRLVQGDMTNFKAPPGRFEYVVHAATERHFEPDHDRPLGIFDSEISGTRRVLEFARTHGVRRFLFTSSGAVYGTQPPALSHVSEDYAGAPSTTDSRTAYGHAKRVSEHMCYMYARKFGFDAPIARLFAFVGPMLPLDANFAVGNFIRDALSGGPVRISGDGTPYRSYLYSADLAIWLWAIAIRGASGRPYNVGSPRAVSISDLAHIVIEATGVPTSVIIAKQPERGASAPRYVPDVERASSELGLSSLVSLESGIERTYSWHRDQERKIRE